MEDFSSSIWGQFSWFCSDLKDKNGNYSHTMSAIFVTICIGALLLLWTFKKIRRSHHKAAASLPPGPRGLPLIGYLPFLRPNLHQMFTELAQIYGPIFKLSIGQKIGIVISSPSIAKEVVRDHDIIFANRDPSVASLAFSYGGNDIALAPYGPVWRMLRKVFVHEMQSNANLDAFYDLRRNEVKKSVRYVYDKIGMPINVEELAFSTVINMIASMFWGGSLEGEKGTSPTAEFRTAVSQFRCILGKPNVSDFFPRLARFDLQGVERDMKKASKRIEWIYDHVIDQRIKSSCANGDGETEKQRKDFLQFLLDFKEQENGRPISRTQIKALLMDIVVGGTDTASTVLEWAMAEMMLHPQVLVKVQQELTEVVGNNSIVEECHSKNLIYLQAVVKETLRLHPPAPLLLPRSPTQSCTVGGYTIPKGTTVFLNVWAMHRDPNFWDSPLEFRPERFLGDGINLDYSGNNFYYLPFGSGRRICAGYPLGERIILYVLATLLHMFEWKVPDGVEVDATEKFGIVLEKCTPLVVIPKPRLPNLELYVQEKLMSASK